MVLRIALFAIPMAAISGLVPLLNALDAQVGVAVAAFGLVAVASGIALGCFADRLPELPGARHGRHEAGDHR
jgi:cyanate permease